MVCQLKGMEKQGTMQCIGDEEATIDALIAYIVFEPVTGTYKMGNSSNWRGRGDISPILPMPSSKMDQRHPNSGATICLGGLTHLRCMGLSERNLVPSKKKKVHTVGGFSLVCQGWLPVTFEIGGRTTKQTLYICNKIQVIYFSKAACIDVGILPPYFPRPMTSPPSVTCDPIHPVTQPHKADKLKFDYPKTPLYPLTSENIQNLKKIAVGSICHHSVQQKWEIPGNVRPSSPHSPQRWCNLQSRT